MKINYVILPDSLVVNYGGQTHSIAKGDGRYQDVIAAIRDNQLDKIPKLVDLINHFNAIKGLEVRGNNVYLDDEPLEGVVADRILQFKEQGLPYAPLLKFARKLRLNPSFNSRKMLYKFLEHNGHPITPDGNFIAYRGVTNDFKDIHTKTFDNSVGSTCQVSRDKVDDNPNNTCSFGLHVACYDYAKGFGPQMIEVEVNPVDVVAVPTDYNGTKMRVCSFKVVNVCQNIRNEALYTDSEHVSQLEDDDMLDETENCLICDDSECIDTDCDIDNDPWDTLDLKPSSAIIEAKYNETTKELEVTLHNGDTYIYSNVPVSITYEWEDSPSVGSYYVNYISHGFTFIRK